MPRSAVLVSHFLARTSSNDVADLPFSDAVIVNDRLLATEWAFARNVTADLPAATATEAGTVNAWSSAARVTVELPAGFAADRVTVHVEVPRERIRLGEHCTLETVGRTLMIPLLPETVNSVPPAMAPAASPIDTSTVDPLAVGASVTVTTAITPPSIGDASMLVARHRAKPAFDLQLSHLPAAVRAGPAVMLSDAMSLVEYDSVHCKLAGACPAEVRKARVNDTDPPWTAEPCDRSSEVVWA